MKEREDYFPYYKKLVKMSLKEPIAEAPEYKILAERYPHLAKSIKLKREIRILKEKLRSLEERSVRFQIKREIKRIETKLKQENVQKRLHGESKQATFFNISFTIATFIERISASASSARSILREAYIDIRSINRALFPPTVFDLRSLDTAENGLKVREWIKKHHTKRR